jgi:hypothetical protein
MRTRGLRRAVQFLAVLASLATSQAGATVLLNDTFDAENGGVGQGVYSGFANFTAADVDLLGPGFFASLCQAAGHNNLCVDMEGNGNGSLTTKTAYALGTGSAGIQFDLAGDQRPGRNNTVTVSLVTPAGQMLFSEQFALEDPAPFQTISRTVNIAAPTTAFLRFESGGPADSFGLLLDNVVLSAEAATSPDPGTGSNIPEPAGLLLIAAGLVGAAVSRGRSGTTPA